MLNRRDFVKKSIAAGAGLALGTGSSLSIASSERNDFTYKPERVDWNTDKWNETIFCQLENKELSEIIEKHAAELGCKVYHGEPDSPDILAIPYFVAIVDRNITGEETWDCYSDYCHEVDDKIPCIIVDGLGTCNLPEKKWWIQFLKIDHKAITGHISKIFDQARK